MYTHPHPHTHLDHNLSTKRARGNLLERGQQEGRRRAQLLQERLAGGLGDDDPVIHGLLRQHLFVVRLWGEVVLKLSTVFGS